MAPSQGPPARVLPPLFFLAKSLLLPKLRGKKEHPKTTWSSLFSPQPHGPLSSPQNHMVLSYSLCQNCVILPLLPQNHMALPRVWLPCPGFKSQCQSSSAAPFPTPPTISYTCQHSLFFQPYWAAILSPGRCGPMVWSQSSPSSLAGAATRGSCLPVTSWVEVIPILLGQSTATAISRIYETS